MARFKSELITVCIKDGLWKLHAEFVYESDLIPETIIVPVGFVTDLATVLRLPLIYLAAANTLTKAAVIHDWLYQQCKLKRSVADAIFLEAAKASGASMLRGYPMYLMVRMFGWFFWRA